jgi:hypothetical protein
MFVLLVGQNVKGRGFDSLLWHFWGIADQHPFLHANFTQA